MNSAAASDVWDDDSQFRITSPAEIAGELRSAMANRSLLTIRYGNAHDCTLTTVLDVDSAARAVILDACQNPHDRAKVLSAHTLTLETEVRRIRIRFDSGRAVPVTFEGQPAMQVALPECLVRIQRREAYRIDTPVNEAVNCRFPHPELKNREIVLRVADLSVKGMGIAADPGLWPAEQGSVLKDCRIDLPETGVVTCDALVVRVFEATGTGRHRLWVGCQFLKLPGSAGTLLQKYILRLERARLARSRGIEG
jgi:c-di-GMP-binding flagellar brake protein YcgR